MNGQELLMGLSYIDRKYIQESEQDTIPKQGRRMIRRPLLVAAIVALMLLLVGCAVVYVLNLQKLQMGEYHYTEPRYIDEAGNKVYAAEKTRDVLSLQGLAGSPNFQAAQEWFLFEQNYDPDYVHLKEADENPLEVSADYDAYFVYTQDMVDKVDEITEKYGLQLAGELAGVQDYKTEIFFDALGIEQLHRDGADIKYDSGYFYACGNFNMDFDLRVPGGKTVFGSYRYNGKAYFDTVFSSISDAGACEEWVYATSGGQTVLIVADDAYVRVFCDREDAFLSLHLERNGMDRAEIEAAVDGFDLTVIPQRPDMEETRRKLEASYQAWKQEQDAIMATRENPWPYYETYGDVIRFLQEREYAEEYLYALRDITGDGIEELFLGRGGTFGSIKTVKDGKPDTLWSNGTDEGLELCEGNVLRYANGDSYCFMQMNQEGQFEQFLSLGFDPWEESWYYMEGGDTEMTYVSGREYDAMLAEYPVVDLGMKSLGEYPLQ